MVESDADVDEVARAVRQDVGFQYHFLVHLNRAYLTYRKTGGFRNFEHAIMYLGYRQLSRYLGTFLLQASTEKTAPLLYRSAVVRAYHMANVAHVKGLAANETDRAFLIGALSLAPLALGVSMEDVVKSVGVRGHVRDALLGESGPYAPILCFVEATEIGTEYELYTAHEKLQIPGLAANVAMVQAMQSAADVL